jgi:hypothetical protein
LAVSWSDGRHFLARSRLSLVFAACFVVGQFLAFAQALRRYTVGASGALDFWLHPDWSPPLPGWLLLSAILAVLVMLSVVIWRPASIPTRHTLGRSVIRSMTGRPNDGYT